VAEPTLNSEPFELQGEIRREFKRSGNTIAGKPGRKDRGVGKAKESQIKENR
jgi:hypothetical protein